MKVFEMDIKISEIDFSAPKVTFDDWLIAVQDRRSRLNDGQLAQFIKNTIWTTVANGKRKS